MIYLLYRVEKKFADMLSNQYKKPPYGTPLAVQWLGLCASTSGGTGSIPGQGAEIP